MGRHRNTFVSGGVQCVAVIYGSTYVCDMKGHLSHSSSVCGRRTLAEEFQCDTWAIHHGGRPSMARSTHPPRILRTLSFGIRMHQHWPLECSKMSTKIGLRKRPKQGKKLNFKMKVSIMLYWLTPKRAGTGQRL